MEPTGTQNIECLLIYQHKYQLMQLLQEVS